MDNSEALATLGPQDAEQRQTKSTALQQINGNFVLILIDTDSCGRCKSNYHISYDLENPRACSGLEVATSSTVSSLMEYV